ncbi:Zinc finger domain-containing protein [Spironucleus salmonicida]|uniref:Zinc finger domain-containing protein n=1 Tax=Spironucleus salmonicida TaxID=348837 RepID=V6LV48_9EUKA|nr:Zinc finger domain-containing protein [Spironucleus salmonicida]|eukprot:EST48460.1 hypothetical protein SS50377_11409 [Spironucleus salmonicida]
MNRALVAVYKFNDQILAKIPEILETEQNQHELIYRATLSDPYALYALYDESKPSSLITANLRSRKIRNWEKLPHIIYKSYIITNLFSCQHIISTAKIYCSNCEQYFDCKICHDTNSNHSLELGGIACKICSTDLKMSKICKNCDIITHSNQCLTCVDFSFKFDQISLDKNSNEIQISYPVEKLYRHCDKCNICVQKQSYHCKNCRTCIHFENLADHKCGNQRETCAICNGAGINFRLDCGCLSHQICYFDAISKGNFLCKVCKKGVEKIDMKEKQMEYIQIYMQQRSGKGVFQCQCGKKFEFSDQKYCICECGSFECERVQ